jgi:hypothetical protein
MNVYFQVAKLEDITIINGLRKIRHNPLAVDKGAVTATQVFHKDLIAFP